MNIFLTSTPLFPPLLTLQVLTCMRQTGRALAKPQNSVGFCHLHSRRVNQESQVTPAVLKEHLPIVGT